MQVLNIPYNRYHGDYLEFLAMSAENLEKALFEKHHAKWVYRCGQPINNLLLCTTFVRNK